VTERIEKVGMDALETAVRIVVDLLVRGEVEIVEKITEGRRLSAAELRFAIARYPGTLVRPEGDWWQTVELTPITGSVHAFHVAAPMWTAEEGRSDLTLELRLTEFFSGVYRTEILDLHML
jgi:hypothetical protein